MSDWQISAIEVSKQLERLAAAFGRPFATNTQRVRTMVEEYHKALGDLRGIELEGAVDLAIREGERWPMPGKLRQFAMQWRAANRHATGSPGPRRDLCASCHREFYYAGFETLDGVAARLRCQCPQPSERWNTAAALAWREPPEREHNTPPLSAMVADLAGAKSVARVEAEYTQRVAQKRVDYKQLASGEDR